MDKFHPSEILNPKRTLERRNQEAETPTKTSAVHSPAGGRTMTQSEFTSGGPSQRKPGNQSKLIQLLRRHQSSDD